METLSYQRRRQGEWVDVYPTIEVTNNRGSVQRKADLNNPIRIKAYFTPYRGSKAEVVGQQYINTYYMFVKYKPENVDIWSRVRWDGKYWDILNPPEHHHGIRQTAHTTLAIRERTGD